MFALPKLACEPSKAVMNCAPLAGAKSVFAAYGYGGNGTMFGFLAAQLPGDLIAGSRSTRLDDFRIEREGPQSRS
jgi:glycine/D-amino acid oxidase-like deaminating enzyme